VCCFSGFVQIGEKIECDGEEIIAGVFNSIKDCASICRGISTLFAFGTNDFGGIQCESGGCRCSCETIASDVGKCSSNSSGGKVIVNKDYRLYKYQNPDSGNSYYAKRFRLRRQPYNY
jgi:hypothetical protein